METTVCARTQSVAPVQLNIRALSVEGSRGLQCSLNEQCEAEIEVAEPGDGQQDGVSVIGVVGRVLGENPEVFTSVREVDYVAVLECGDQLLWVDVVVADWESCGPVGRDHFEADDGVQKLRHELAARRLPLSKNIFWRGAVSSRSCPMALNRRPFTLSKGASSFPLWSWRKHSAAAEKDSSLGKSTLNSGSSFSPLNLKVSLLSSLIAE